jgi:hypothetical protein
MYAYLRVLTSACIYVYVYVCVSARIDVCIHCLSRDRCPEDVDRCLAESSKTVIPCEKTRFQCGDGMEASPGNAGERERERERKRE